MTKYQKFKLIIFTSFLLMLLIILCGFLKAYNDNSSNGRYVREGFFILDSRTGTVYSPNSKTELYEPSKSDKKEKE